MPSSRLETVQAWTIRNRRIRGPVRAPVSSGGDSTVTISSATRVWIGGRTLPVGADTASRAREFRSVNDAR